MSYNQFLIPNSIWNHFFLSIFFSSLLCIFLLKAKHIACLGRLMMVVSSYCNVTVEGKKQRQSRKRERLNTRELQCSLGSLWTFWSPTVRCDLWFNNLIICFFTQGRPISLDWPPTANKRRKTQQSLKQTMIYDKQNAKKVRFFWN